MIKFNELRISSNRYLIIDVSVKNEDYYKDVYIKSVSVDTQDTYIDSGPSNNPIFIIDDSDVTKPLGEKFEDLGIVRDGSSKNKTYEKGYHHTEIIGLTPLKSNLVLPIL